MKLFGGILTLVMALIISGVAGFFSVIGLGHLFAGAFWPVVIMGTALETGKIVASSWLKANWKNKLVSRTHKLYLVLAVGVLMAITALGVYGYLAKGHLEQEAPLAAIELKIKGIESRSRQIEQERERLEQRLAGLDQAVNTLLSNAKTAKESQAADRARQAQRKDRLDIQKQVNAKNDEINKLGADLVPLKLQISDVSAKLGPVKYVAQLFGWQDPNTAVQMVIVMIMFAFDPLALVLVLSGMITIGEWSRQRIERKAAAERKAALDNIVLDEPVTVPDFKTRYGYKPDEAVTEDLIFPQHVEGRGSHVTELPKGEDLGDLPDLDYFRNKVAVGLRVPDAYLGLANSTANASIFPDFAVAAPMPVANSTTDDLDPLHLLAQLSLAQDEQTRLAAEKRDLAAQVRALIADGSAEKATLETELHEAHRAKEAATEENSELWRINADLVVGQMEVEERIAHANAAGRAFHDEIVRLKAELAKPGRAPIVIVPAVYGSVQVASDAPVVATATMGQPAWTTTLPNLDGNKLVFEVPRPEPAFPFLQSLANDEVTEEHQEKLTETGAIKDTTNRVEDFHAFSETMFKPDTK
jgi:hypothetical protein